MIALSTATPLVTLSSDRTSLSSTFVRRRGERGGEQRGRDGTTEFDRLHGVGSVRQ